MLRTGEPQRRAAELGSRAARRPGRSGSSMSRRCARSACGPASTSPMACRRRGPCARRSSPGGSWSRTPTAAHVAHRPAVRDHRGRAAVGGRRDPVRAGGAVPVADPSPAEAAALAERAARRRPLARNPRRSAAARRRLARLATDRRRWSSRLVLTDQVGRIRHPRRAVRRLEELVDEHGRARPPRPASTALLLRGGVVAGRVAPRPVTALLQPPDPSRNSRGRAARRGAAVRPPSRHAPRRRGSGSTSTCSARPSSATTRPSAGSAGARPHRPARRGLRVGQGVRGLRPPVEPGVLPVRRSGGRRVDDDLPRRRPPADPRCSSTSTWRSTATSSSRCGAFQQTLSEPDLAGSRRGHRAPGLPARLARRARSSSPRGRLPGTATAAGGSRSAWSRAPTWPWSAWRPSCTAGFRRRIPTKVEVDASYKRLASRALDPCWGDALHVGLASHNLYDVAWGLLAARGAGHVGSPRGRDARGDGARAGRGGAAPRHARAAVRAGGRPRASSTRPSPTSPAGSTRTAPPTTTSAISPRIASTPERGASSPTPSNGRREHRAAARQDRTARGGPSRSRSTTPFANAGRHRLGPGRQPGVGAARHRTAPSGRRSCRAESASTCDGGALTVLSPDPSARPRRRCTPTASPTAALVDQAVGRAAGAARADRGHRRHARPRRRPAWQPCRGELIAAMVADAGKTVAEADVEVSEAVDYADYYARQALELDRHDAVAPPARHGRGRAAVELPARHPARRGPRRPGRRQRGDPQAGARDRPHRVARRPLPLGGRRPRRPAAVPPVSPTTPSGGA